MIGKTAYNFHRQSGRMIMDSRQRMTNRAEAGMAMPGLIGIIILALIVIGVFF